MEEKSMIKCNISSYIKYLCWSFLFLIVSTYVAWAEESRCKTVEEYKKAGTDETEVTYTVKEVTDESGEKKNIIEDHPELAKRMRKILKEHVRNGRSTPGAPQKNTDDHVWETVKWLLEED
jgi:hypothetical protein